MEASAAGMRALWVSLAVLAATAALQAVVVAVSGSVALLGDTLHNAADALTAVPLGIAFMLGRRPPSRRYTYGYGRAEDLAGVVIVLVIAASSALAGYAAVTRLAHPHPVSDLIAVAGAAVIGFLGNEAVARYRIRTGRRIGSAALVADGLHARADGFTSLAVLLGAGGVAAGWDWADPVVGLLITGAILARAVAGGPGDLPAADGRGRPGRWWTRWSGPCAARRGCSAWARCGCAGSGTTCAPNARSSWPVRPPRCRRTRWRWTRSTGCCMRCPG